jgi:hypothetical protein
LSSGPSALQLHKVFRTRFGVDDALFQAQGFVAERKDCDCRKLLPKAPIARSPRRDARHSEIAIDPVETGFPGAGMSRETQS